MNGIFRSLVAGNVISVTGSLFLGNLNSFSLLSGSLTGLAFHAANRINSVALNILTIPMSMTICCLLRSAMGEETSYFDVLREDGCQFVVGALCDIGIACALVDLAEHVRGFYEQFMRPDPQAALLIEIFRSSPPAA